MKKQKQIEEVGKIEFLESVKSNLERTLEECGETFQELKKIFEWLATHNKNYTKEQYNKILTALEIIESL